MRKEHILFLTLITAAAVIAGSTVSLATNMKYIIGNIEKSTGIEVQTQQVADKSIEHNSEGTKTSRGSDGRDLPSVDGINYEAMTDVEKQQIMEMLASLGMTNEAEYTAFITDFQAKHSLQPTGVLDSETLDAIVEQIKLQRVLNEVRS